MPIKKTADAITLLKKDHQKVRTLLKKLTSTENRDTRRNLFDQIDSDLQTHTRIEEEIFYPAFRDAVRTKEQKKLYYEGMAEHHVVEMVLPEMRSYSLTPQEFAAKAKVLRDLVEHHAAEEERVMFPKARKALGATALFELGVRMQRKKDQLSAGMWDRSLEVFNPFARRSTITPVRKRRAA